MGWVSVPATVRSASLTPLLYCPARLADGPRTAASRLGGYFFRFFKEVRPALLELIFDGTYCQVSEPFAKSDPERLEYDS
jgi:hypothetical protein